MTTNFLTGTIGGDAADLDEVLVNKDAFLCGSLYSWGFGGNSGPNYGTAMQATSRSSPTSCTTYPTTTFGIRNIRAGAYSLVFQRVTGEWFAVGGNQYYALGGAPWPGTSSPVSILVNNRQQTVQVFVNGESAYALEGQSGLLYGRGLNGQGQLGNGVTTAQSMFSSMPLYTGTFKSFMHAPLAQQFVGWTDITNTAWFMGANDQGQFGNNSTIANSSSPVTPVGGLKFKRLAGGGAHILGITTSGTLYSWGYNVFGQLGDNTSVNRSSPVTVTGGGTWRYVGCGLNYSFAIKTDGTLWAWGDNNYGALGDNTTTLSRSSPVQIAGGGTTWKKVVSGSFHTLGLKYDGTIWGWGRNDSGQVGDNTTLDRSSPVQVSGGGTNWVDIAAGGNNVNGSGFSFAIKQTAIRTYV